MLFLYKNHAKNKAIFGHDFRGMKHCETFYNVYVKQIKLLFAQILRRVRRDFWFCLIK